MARLNFPARIMLLVSISFPLIASADVVAPDSAIATSNFFAPAENLITGLGLIDDGSPVEDQLHNNVEAEGWLSGTTDLLGGAVTAVDQVVNFDFNVNHDLTGIYIWQYNGVNGEGDFTPGRQVTDFEIFVTSNDADPLVSAGTYTLGASTDMGAGAGEPSQFIPFNAPVDDVFRIQIHVDDTVGGQAQDFVGLAEVRFEGAPVPEPSGFGLLLASMFGILMLRRKATRS